ncbi:hypothetical protein GQR58_030476 [Nymphon striatum]|nr:hypothetical protein GQR58_030476 [Nymphon striatum]
MACAPKSAALLSGCAGGGDLSGQNDVADQRRHIHGQPQPDGCLQPARPWLGRSGQAKTPDLDQNSFLCAEQSWSAGNWAEIQPGRFAKLRHRPLTIQSKSSCWSAEPSPLRGFHRSAATLHSGAALFTIMSRQGITFTLSTSKSWVIKFRNTDKVEGYKPFPLTRRFHFKEFQKRFQTNGFYDFRSKNPVAIFICLTTKSQYAPTYKEYAPHRQLSDTRNLIQTNRKFHGLPSQRWHTYLIYSSGRDRLRQRKSYAVSWIATAVER